jgi:Ca2+-binding RTX toxin-like protein
MIGDLLRFQLHLTEQLAQQPNGASVSYVFALMGLTALAVETLTVQLSDTGTFASLSYAQSTGTALTDTLIAGGPAPAHLRGLDGDDTLTGAAGDDVLDGGNGNDTILTGEGWNLARGDAGNDTLTGGSDKDALHGGVGNDIVNGGGGNDTITGDEGDDMLNGEAGDDSLTGGFGSDTLLGGAGHDTLSGQADDDQLFGDGGNDSLNGGSGHDSVRGGSGIDTLTGGLGGDLFVWATADTDGSLDVITDLAFDDGDRLSLQGVLTFGRETGESIASFVRVVASGADSRIEFDGNGSVGGAAFIPLALVKGIASLGAVTDLLAAGRLLTIPLNTAPVAFADTVSVLRGDPVAGNVTTNNGQGADTDAEGDAISVSALSLTTSAGGRLILSTDGQFSYQAEIGFVGTETFAYTIKDRFGASATAVATLNIAARAGDTIGTAAADTIYGTAGNDIITTLAGNDIVRGGAGNDIIYAGLGDDDARGDDGDDTLFGGSGADRLEGNAGNDTLQGGIGDDILRGGTGNDMLDGGDGADDMLGSDGNDVLIGGAGNDLIYGELGNDTLQGDDGADQLRGNEGNDVLVGGAGDDIIYGDVNSSDTIIGDDTLDGGTGNDSLHGGLGNDRYVASPGQDYVNDRGGIDSIRFARALDLAAFQFAIDPTDTNDLFITTANLAPNPDRIHIENQLGSAASRIESLVFADRGTLAIDRFANWVNGTSANNTLNGTTGNDTLNGDGGDDTIAGNTGNDELIGGTGNDMLNGQDGNDMLHGGAGDDILSGGNGNDILIAGQGVDYLDGGTGADTYVLYGADAFSGLNRLIGFNRAEGDSLVLADLLTDYDPVTDLIAEFITITQGASHTQITVDRDGAGTAFAAQQIAQIDNVVGQWSTAQGMIDDGALIVERPQ